MNGPLKEITDLIETFRRNFRLGDCRVTAHFVPNDLVPKGTIYVMLLKPMHLDPTAHLEAPNIDLDKDYGIAVHPESLQMIRSEFHRLFPEQRLNDNEIAVILAEGALDRHKRS